MKGTTDGMADNKETINDPFDELKGYFPEGLDLSPDELEQAIETENKQCEIALRMTQPKTSADTVAAPSSESYVDDISTDSTGSADEADLADEDTDSEAIEADPKEYTEDIGEDDSSEQWIPPFAEAVDKNELLNKYDSLDALLDELETSDKDEAEEKKSDGDRLLKAASWAFDFLEIFAICMACIILIFTFFARLTKVDGPSMENTLKDSQYLIISDFAYTPKAGDIVVFQNTSLSLDLLRNPLVKRIIAVGGQTVDISVDGKVTVTDKNGNTTELDQSFIKEKIYMSTDYHCEVPEGYVFVMGDNRNNSTDSRDPRVGLVDERCIFGRALFRVLPLSEFTIFENPYND